MHQLHVPSSLTGFIDASQLVSDAEEVEQVRKGTENRGSPVSLDHFAVKVSSILASASLTAVNLNAAKMQELGIAHINIDAFARSLWRKARSLITHLDLDSDSFATGSEATMSTSPRAPPSLADSHAASRQTVSTSTAPSKLLLRIVAIKMLLLLAARSFAAPSEYLRLHLDTISSAVETSLDSPWDDDVPLEEREWRWQLWSFLCVLDWTSPGVYHNGSYFIRSEMYSDPPSKIPGVPDEGTHSPAIETEHSERLAQTRYFLEYALALANLSRRADDCIIRPGPIPPAQAADLCSELDALDNKLNFYKFLGGSASGGERVNGRVSSHTSNKHQISPQEALRVQNVYLSLELGLIRFKLFRHEAFHQMHDATTSGPLRRMCMDACMDACIFLLSQCRSIAMDVPHMVNLGAEGMRDMVTDLTSSAHEEQGAFPGTFRRVIQPASSAALVGQVLLHALQSTDGLGLLIPDKHAKTSGQMSKVGINSSIGGSSTSNFPSYAERSMDSFAPYSFAKANGSACWTDRFERKKVSMLQWHVNAVLTELEALQSTSPLARYKLTLHRQCM